MSEAIDILMKEHRIIEKVLASLKAFANSLSSMHESDRKDIEDYARFFREFADRCHHGKEEDLLFAALARAGMPTEMGPLKVMYQEHNLGRARVRELTEIGAGQGPLKETELVQVQRSASEFIEVLRDHIKKEDNILFPAAIHNLDTETLKDLSVKFKSFEQNQMGAGAHDQLHRLAEDLIQRYPPSNQSISTA